ncbi:MAG: hypothetical protein COB53_03955 [Elusimicrobia bacterium]|nr:MAG: hypothetical protein COB53_03955 [Elusimicrobiota bacterium]
MKRILPIVFLGFSVVMLDGCGGMQMRGTKKKIILQDFAEGRVVQVNITDRLTGAKEMLFVSMPKKSLFFEGYIQGIVTDYEDNPVQGVVVRAVAKGEQKFVAKGEAAFQTSSFDAGVSDSNGIYRIRFSLPILKNRVDIQGKLVYNPGWEQELENLKKAYKPQMDESPFRLYFDQRSGMLVFAEGVRKVIVQPIESGKAAPGRRLPGAAAPAQKKSDKKDGDDLFGDFGFD